MPGRKYSSNGSYRYGFNGKENDNDVKGEGNQQDYGMRIYDTRLGRFLSVDPLTKKYPELTPYQFASDRPIDGIDLDGLEYLSAGSAAWVLQHGKYKASAFLGEIYKRDELSVRNEEAYEVSAKQIENAVKYAEHFTPEEPQEFEKGKEAHEPGPKPIVTKADKAGAVGDAVTEIAQTVQLFKVFQDMYKAKYDKETKKNIDIANTTWKGLSDANLLVTQAANSSTFPTKLKTDKILSDLVNFVTDGTKPSANNFLDPYSIVIQTWGNLIFKNKDGIAKGTMSFSTEKWEAITKTVLGGTRTTIWVPVGNSDPEVKTANDLIKVRVPDPVSTVKQSND